jgi:predicted nucleic acid-binding protein
MTFYYLDASAWVKRYAKEVGANWMQSLFDQRPLMASASLGLVEVMATLARKQKARELAAAQFAQKTQTLERDWDRFIQIHFTPEAVYLASESARKLALRGADAVHLAAGLLLQQRFAQDDDQVIFVTSDRELKTAAQASGLAVIDPAERETDTAST